MVSGSRWLEVDAIFAAALELPPGERARWLAAVCSRKPEVRSRVERLLSYAEQEDERIPLGTRDRILHLVHEFIGERARRSLSELLDPGETAD